MVILKKRGGGANPYHSAQIILRPGVKSGSASLKSSDHWTGRLAEGSLFLPGLGLFRIYTCKKLEIGESGRECTITAPGAPELPGINLRLDPLKRCKSFGIRKLSGGAARER